MSLEDRVRTALADVLADARSRLEAEFAAVLTDARAEADHDKAAALARAADAQSAAVADAQRVLEQRLRADFDAEKGHLAVLHADLLAQAADTARLELTRAAESSAAEVDAIRADAEVQRVSAESTIEALRAELREVRASAVQQREMLEIELGRARHDHEADVIRLREEIAAVAASRDGADVALARFREEQETVRAALRADAEAALVAVRAESDARLTALRAEVDAKTAASHADSAALIASLRAEAHQAQTAHSRAVEAHHATVSRLLESTRALDGAGSLSEVLDALAAAAGREAARAAVLVVKGERLIGWKSQGFGDLDRDPRGIVSSVTDASALANAVNTSRPAVVGAGSVLAAPSFTSLGPDAAGLAVPLLVAAKPVAVLYADHPAPAAGWTAPLELLVRHAARCLEGLAVHRHAQAKAAPARLGATA